MNKKDGIPLFGGAIQSSHLVNNEAITRSFKLALITHKHDRGQMLRYYPFLCFLVVALGVERYTDKYDNIDLDEILGNKRLLIAYTNCILEKGKCSPEGKELKEHLQDALETGCAKCTEAQNKGATKIITYLAKYETDIWNDLTTKFDPQNKWREKYEDRVRAMGIIID